MNRGDARILVENPRIKGVVVVGRKGGREDVGGWKRKRKRPQEGTMTLDQFVSPLPIVQSGIDSPALGGALVTANSRESQRTAPDFWSCRVSVPNPVQDEVVPYHASVYTYTLFGFPVFSMLCL